MTENKRNERMAKLAGMSPLHYLLRTDAACMVMCHKGYSQRVFDLACKVDEAIESIFDAVTRGE